MKTCNRCNIEKDLERFVLKPHGKRMGYCKECYNEKRRSRIKERTPEQKRKSYKTYSELDSESIEKKKLKERLRYERLKADPERMARRKAKQMEINKTNERKEYLRNYSKNRYKKVAKDRLSGQIGKYCNVDFGSCYICNSLACKNPKMAIIKCNDCIRKGKVKAYNLIKFCCSICSVEYMSTKRNKSICSKCQKKNEKRSSASKFKRRIENRVKNKIEMQRIDVDKIYFRDNYKCYCCKKTVVKSKQYKPNQATIDHIIPLSLGGSHTIDNVRTMCQRCNSQRGNKVESGTQIGLFCMVDK